VTYSAADDTPAVEGNEEAIRQIVLNLVRNAIRHTESGGSVHVATRGAVRDQETFAVAEICDTGCGIPESMIHQIFDAGFSATGETPGLGLAVCQRLMAQHGGEIRVTSHINQGSTFLLEFPAL
jgi:signal transduction histidine kinase